jgi:hypothetical protein
LLKDFAQGGVVEQQGFVNFGQAPEDGGVGGEVLAHFDESADDVQAHGNRAGAVENRGGHEGAVFGEGKGQSASPPCPAYDIANCDVKASLSIGLS